jgi:hypothetical protein
MADNTDVKYTLILEGIDRLESSLKTAKHHTDELGDAMGHLKTVVVEAIAAYAGFETLKESLKDFQAHKVAVAELTAMYKNNSEGMSENVEQLKEIAEKQQKQTGVFAENTMAAESALMKYKGLKIGMEELIPVMADMAGKTYDVASKADLMGRALTHPETAARLLRQEGIFLGKQQQELLAHLNETGKQAEAQGIIFEALKQKFQGVSQAIYDADTSQQLAIGFKEVKEQIGEFIERGLIRMMPYIKALMEHIKDVVKWMDEHRKVVMAVVEVVGVAVAIWGTYTLILKAGAAAMAIAEGAQLALNTAMSANPIGLIITLVSALIVELGILYANYKSIEELHETQAQKALTDGIKKENDQLELLTKSYQNHMHITKELAQQKAMILEKNNLMEEEQNLNREKRDMQLKGELTESQSRIFDLRYQDLIGRKKALETFGKGEKGATGKNALIPESQSDKVTGTKQVVINVSINKLVEMIKIEAQNIREGASSAGSDVAKALLGAVDQFSASADI